MKQFTFTSQLAPIIWKYLESRQNEGYTSVHCGYYMQELDCLSKELSDAPVVTKELIDAWDLLKPYLSNRSKIVRHNAMHLLRAGVNMIYIRDFLGHADISTTEVYARIDAEMKRKVFEEKVPNYTPNTTMPWEEDEDLLQWLTQFGKKTF